MRDGRATGLGAGGQRTGGRFEALPELAIVDTRDGAVVVQGAGTVAGLGRVAHRVGPVVSVQRKWVVADGDGEKRNGYTTERM